MADQRNGAGSRRADRASPEGCWSAPTVDGLRTSRAIVAALEAAEPLGGARPRTRKAAPGAAEAVGSRGTEQLPRGLGRDVGRPAPLLAGHGGSGIVGVKALMLAVLEDALRCAQSTLRHRSVDPPRLRQQALRWMEATHDKRLFSFATICETLGMDPRAVRAVVRTWTARRGAAREADPPSSGAARPHRLYLRAARPKTVRGESVRR